MQPYFGMFKTSKEIPGYYNLMKEDAPKCFIVSKNAVIGDGNHEFVEIESPRLQSGWHVDQCRNCGIKVGYDTSD